MTTKFSLLLALIAAPSFASPAREFSRTVSLNDARTEIKTGRWLLKSAAIGEITLETADTPSCPYGMAIYYGSGETASVEPAQAKKGLFSFRLQIQDKIYLADLNGTGDKLSGTLTDLATKEPTPVEASFIEVGTNEFEVTAVTASLNAPGEEHSDGSWWVRTPAIHTMPGDLVFHRGTEKYFGCYRLNQDGGQQAFTYSESPYFIIVMTDLKPESHPLWKLYLGKARLQKDPFVLSVAGEGGASVDFVKRP